VPAGLIVPPVTAAINELAGALGYRPVDADWGTPGRAADPRVPGTIRGPAPPSGGGPAPGSGALEESLRARIDAAGERFAGQWQSCAADKFLIVSRAATGGSETQWLVDITAGTITAEDTASDSSPGEDGTGEDDVTWSILGSPQSWQDVLSGQLNLQAALRRNDLRYCPADSESPEASQTRIAMLADLLGLGAWANADAARPDAVPVS
jgi:hypothetical protein